MAHFGPATFGSSCSIERVLPDGRSPGLIDDAFRLARRFVLKDDGGCFTFNCAALKPEDNELRPYLAGSTAANPADPGR